MRSEIPDGTALIRNVHSQRQSVNVNYKILMATSTQGSGLGVSFSVQSSIPNYRVSNQYCAIKGTSQRLVF